MNNLLKLNFGKRKRLTSLLGLSLDGSRLEGVVLRRNNGSLSMQQTFSAVLSLDPLTAAPELVGREIQNHLEAAGVRERLCIVGLPLKWVLTAGTELPPLPEADAASLLQLEAEKGFHSDISTLQLAESRCSLTGDKKRITFAAVSKSQIEPLIAVLAAAKLKPVSFSLGLSALQPPGAKNGVLALVVGETGVGLQITCNGGVAALRGFEGTVENEGSRRTLQAGVVAREGANYSFWDNCRQNCAPSSNKSGFLARRSGHANWPMKWNWLLSQWAWASKSSRPIRRMSLAWRFPKTPQSQQRSVLPRAVWPGSRPCLNFCRPARQSSNNLLRNIHRANFAVQA